MAKSERENIINWTEGEKTARLYIVSRKLKNRLAKYSVKPIEKDEEAPFGETFEVPRNWIRVQKPSGEGRVRTEEQKTAARKRLKAARDRRAAEREKSGKPKKAAAAEEADETETEAEAPAPKKSGMKTIPKKAAAKPEVEDDDGEEVEVVRPKKKSA